MSFLLFSLLSGAASLFAAPLAFRLSYAVGAVDIPDGGRHRHARPIPRGGGFAFFVATLPAVMLYGVFFRSDGNLLSAFVLGGAAVFIVGYVDDARALSPRTKLLAETCLFSLLLPIFGFLMPMPSLLSFLLMLGFLLLCTNSVNIIDGADGIAASSAMASFFGFLILAAEIGSRDILMLSLILLFALLGFFPYNAPSARLFMGDGGSLFLGFAEGMCALSLIRAGVLPVRVLFCIALPLFDLMFAFLRRIRQRRPLFIGDSAHIHHRLAARGYSPHAVLAIMLTASLALALTGVLLIK